MQVNRQTNAVIAAIAGSFVGNDYDFRTVGALAKATGYSATAAEIEAVAQELGCDTSKTRRRDGAKLVGKPEDADTVAAIANALKDPQYTMRTAKAIANEAEVYSEDVIDVAEAIGYAIKTRRHDGAKLVALSA